MLLSSLYLLVLIGICAAALADCLRVPRDRQESRATAAGRLRLRLILPWIGGWLLFQGFFGLLFLLSGEGSRVLPYLFYFGLASLPLPFLLQAGASWTAAAGTPLFPLTRALHCAFSWKQRPGLRTVSRARFLRCAFRILPQVAALAVVPILSTAVLFRMVHWRPAAELAESLQVEQRGAAADLLLLVYLLTSAAVLEEILFRHYLLNRLLARPRAASGRRSWATVIAAVVAVAVLWALGHGGMVEPAWMKWTQILIYGVALGIAQIRFGLEAAVGIHLLFNTAAVVLGSLFTAGVP